MNPGTGKAGWSSFRCARLDRVDPWPRAAALAKPADAWQTPGW